MNFISHSWREVSLGEICEFRYGKALPDSTRQDGDVRVFGSNGVVGRHNASVTDGPTVVVGRKGSIGKVSYSPVSCWPIDTTYYVDRSCTQQDVKWLSRALDSLRLTELNKSAAVPGLNREDAYRQKLLLPPLPEQRRIAAILDQADALRAKRREALAKLDEMARAIFVEMFGDPATNPFDFPQVRIGDLLASANYGSSGKAGEIGTFPILRMNNLTSDGKIVTDSLKYIDLTEAEIPKYTVEDGDILFNRTNSPDLVGKTAVFRGSDTFAFAGYLVRLRTNGRAAPDYISGFLNSPYGKAILRGMCKTIIGMANINAKEVQRIQIPAPPINLQRTFAKRLTAIREVRKPHEKALLSAGDLFTSLQHRAFSGTL